MKNLKNQIWIYYLNLPTKSKIKRDIFFHRLKRFIKRENPKQIEEFYDFIFIRIIKKDFLKWAKILGKKKLYK